MLTLRGGARGKEARRMRALDCQCGKHLEANNDEEPNGQAREHVDRDHPEMQLSDEQVQGIVAEGAYDK